MSRIVRTAATAALGGSCFALALLWLAAGSRAPEPSPPQAERSETAVIAVPDHCPAATSADATCQAAWTAKRRRFLGQGDETP